MLGLRLPGAGIRRDGLGIRHRQRASIRATMVALLEASERAETTEATVPH